MKWEVKTLDQLCRHITDGVHHRPNYIDSGVPFLSVKNLTKGFIDFSDTKFISLEDHQQLIKRCNPEINDVLYTKVGTTGVAKVVDIEKEFSLFVSVALLKPKHDVVFNKYLEYYLNSDLGRKQAKKRTRGMANKNLVIRDIKQITVSYPSDLEEQKRIVEILDESFAGIERAEAIARQNLTNARELFDSYLNKIFTNNLDRWEYKNLKDIAIEFGRGKSKHRPRNDDRLYGGEYPFIQTGDIRNSSHVIKSYSQTYNDFGLAQSKLWKKGTVCITIAANIAETAVLGFDACFPDSVIGIYTDETKAHNMFVEYLLQSFKVILQAEGKGSAQDNINMGTFKDKLFPFPNIEEQKKITDNLDELSENIQKLETIYQRKIEALGELKQSILQKAFTGQLTQ